MAPLLSGLKNPVSTCFLPQLNAESVEPNSPIQPNTTNAPSAFDGGAVRSEKLPPLEDIPYALLEEIAKRYAIGEEKYGRDNWKRGGPEFFRQAYSHAIRHLMLAANRNETEESILSNLGAAAWGIGIILWWEKEGKSAYTKTSKDTTTTNSA